MKFIDNKNIIVKKWGGGVIFDFKKLVLVVYSKYEKRGCL